MALAETSLPLAPIFTRSRRPAPTIVFCTIIIPSTRGIPRESENSSGAAPVPPSPPSTTMKSGRMSVSSIARTMAMNSRGSPMQILKPTGFPPDSSRSCAMKATISKGVEKAL